MTNIPSNTAALVSLSLSGDAEAFEWSDPRKPAFILFLDFMIFILVNSFLMFDPTQPRGLCIQDLLHDQSL